MVAIIKNKTKQKKKKMRNKTKSLKKSFMKNTKTLTFNMLVSNM